MSIPLSKNFELHEGNSTDSREFVERISKKDMQHRGPKGIVGKYLLALAEENEEAHEQLVDAIKERRERIRGEIEDLKEEETNLLQAQLSLSDSSE